MYEIAHRLLNASLDPKDVIYLYRTMDCRDMNPDQWDDQLKFWSKIVKKWGLQANVIDFSTEELTTALMYDRLLPPLQPSLTFLVKTRVLKPIDTYLTRRSVLWSVTSAIFGYVFPRDPPPSPAYVFPMNLRERADRFVAEVSTRAGTLADLCLPQGELRPSAPSLNLDLLRAELAQMARAVETRPGGFFVRNAAFGAPARDVIDGIIATKATLARIASDVERYSQVAEDEYRRARQLHAQGRRAQALQCLRMRRVMENRLDNLNGIRIQLETALDQIDTGDLTATAAETMRRLTKAGTPKVEDVEEIIEDAREQGRANDELARAIEPAPVDDGGLERELDEMIAGIPDRLEGREVFPRTRILA
jgi:hypothetical protein